MKYEEVLAHEALRRAALLAFHMVEQAALRSLSSIKWDRQTGSPGWAYVSDYAPLVEVPPDADAKDRERKTAHELMSHRHVGERCLHWTLFTDGAARREDFWGLAAAYVYEEPNQPPLVRLERVFHAAVPPSDTPWRLSLTCDTPTYPLSNRQVARFVSEVRMPKALRAAQASVERNLTDGQPYRADATVCDLSDTEARATLLGIGATMIYLDAQRRRTRS